MTLPEPCKRPKIYGNPIDPNLLRVVALGMADGQIEQADRWLLVADGRARRTTRNSHPSPLVVALEHLRSACGWLILAVQHT